MFVIHHTTDVANSLHFRSVEFFSRMGLNPPEFADCLTIVRTLLDDIMSRRFLWCAEQNSLEDVVNEIMQWDDTTVLRHSQSGKTIAPFDLYFREVLDDFELATQEWVANFIPEPTYDIWYLTQFGRELVIDKGPDFRIVDWERRMKSGEWQ